MNLNELTIVQAQEGLRNKEFTSVELTKACLARVNERNKDINAFITVADISALEEARRADDMIARGEGWPLAGIPFAVKDAICTKDVRSTASSKILDNYTPPFDATVVKKIREQGGVLIGKTNCDAFGHGASNENSMYGPVKNPHDLTKVAGGSSGGSAAAVADNMCIFSIGEDTGGSIRYPAGFCGVVGMRPSYGRNSRYGIMPMASSLDTVGPMTKTVEDMAIVMREIAGVDPLDATTVSDDVPDYIDEVKGERLKVKGLRIGVPKEYFEVDGMDPEVKAITNKLINQLTNNFTVEEVSLPHTKYATAVYYVVVPSEDSSNLARLDGIRYGVRNTEGRTLFAMYARSRELGFPEEVKRRIMIGTYALSAGYYDAYYKKAQQVRTLIIQDFDEVFSAQGGSASGGKKVDVLITPTSPFPPFGIGEKMADPLAMYLADVMMSPASLAGVSAISVPAGKTKAGLPVGIQIIGPRMAEGLLMRVGNLIEP